MSLKSGEGKSLKGDKGSAQGGNIDIRAIIAALSNSGMTLSNVSLQSVVIYSGMMDDVLIGSQQPQAATFTNVQIGLPDGNGGGFVAYGNVPEKLTYDTDGNVIAREPGDSITWNPVTSTFDILGGLSVRDPTTLGNIRIMDNRIVAVAPEDGNVEIYPESSTGNILLGGNISQNLSGSVKFDMATTFSVDADYTSTVNSRGLNTISSDRGNVSIITDAKAENEILSIEHLRVTTRDDVTLFSNPDGSTTTQTISLSQNILGTTVILDEITKINSVVTTIKKTTKTKTVSEHGEPATKTVSEITVITPATPLEEEKRETTTVVETTLDKDFPNPISVLENGQTVHTAIFTTAGKHGFLPGEEVTISGTNSDPHFDGLVSIENVTADNKFTLTSPIPFIEGSGGKITVPKTGSLQLYAGKEVSFQIDVPIFFGEEDIPDRPYIEAETKDDLIFSAKYVRSFDPIPTLQTHSNNFSDSGISVEYTVGTEVKNGFFGFVESTQNFTWVPDAIITMNADGTKSVSGKKGIMELQGVQLSELIGDPDLVIKTPGGGITFATRDPISFDSALRIGEGIISPAGNGLNISAPGDLTLNPGLAVVIPQDHPLKFSDSTSITGTPGGGLSITSSIEPVLFNGDISLPTGNYLYLGDDKNNSISGDGNTILIAPKDKVVIPDDIYLQIGDVSSTGLVAHDGTLSLKAVADTVISSGGDTRVVTGGGQFFIDSLQTILPTSSEFLFGNSSGISTIAGTGMNFTSVLPINMNSPVINLNAQTGINIPTDVPLIFGDTGGDAQIMFDGTDNRLHIKNTLGVVIDKNLVVSGTLTVYGTTTEITSTKTTLEDPIITLGKNVIGENVKDRGVEFFYGDGKLGFMGFSQQDGRFYMIKEGQNIDEVFTKNVLGDLQVGKIYADVIASTGGFLTSVINGDPGLKINATNIDFAATQTVSIPYHIPLHFGENNTIIGTPEELTLSTGNVAIEKGSLSISDAKFKWVDPSDFHISDMTNLFLDSKVIIPDTLQFGSNSANSIIKDTHGNLILSAENQIQFQTPVLIDRDLILNHAKFSWSDEKLILRNTTTGQPLDFSLLGNIRDATWMGKPIAVEYGGTGRLEPWHAKSVIFVGDSNIEFDEDNDNFNYDHVHKVLNLRTTNGTNTLTIGSGHVEFLHDESRILYRHAGIITYQVGKIGANYIISNPSTTTPSTNPEHFIMNPFGQVGITQTIDFMSSLSGTERTRLYVGGDISFTKFGSALMYSATTYIRQMEDGALNIFSEGALNISSASYLNMTSGDRLSMESTSSLHINSGNQLEISSENGLDVSSGDILNITSSATLSLESADTLNVNSGSSLTMASGDILNVTSASALNVTSMSVLTVKSSDRLDLESLSKLTVKSSDRLDLESLSKLTVKSGDRLDLSSIGTLSLYSSDQLAIESLLALQVKSGSSMNISSNDILNVTSRSSLLLHSDSMFRLESSSSLDVYSSNSLSVKSASTLNVESASVLEVKSASALNLTSMDTLTMTSSQLLKLYSSDRLEIASLSQLTVKSEDKLNITSVSALNLTSGDALTVSSVSDIDVTSASALKINAGGFLQVKSADVLTVTSLSTLNLNSASNLYISSSDHLTMSSVNTLDVSSGDALNISSVSLLHIHSDDLLKLSSVTGLEIESAEKLKLSSLSEFELSSGNKFTISSADTLTLSSARELNIQSDDKLEMTSAATLNISSVEAFTLKSGSVLDMTSDEDLNITSLDEMTITSASLLKIKSTDDLQLTSDRALAMTSASSLILSSADVLSISSSRALSLNSADQLNVHSAKDLTVSTEEHLIISSASEANIISASSLIMSSGDMLKMASAASLLIKSDLDFDMSSASSMRIFSVNDLEVASDNSLKIASGDQIKMSSLSSIEIESGDFIDMTSVSTLRMSSQDKLFIESDSALNISSEDQLDIDSVSDLNITSANNIGISSDSNLKMTSLSTIEQTSTGIFTITSEDLLKLKSTGGGGMSLISSSSIDMNSGENLSVTSADKLLLSASADFRLKSDTSSIFMESNVMFDEIAYFKEESTRILGRLGGYLDVASTRMITLDSPHVLIPQRLCFKHDPVTDECLVYQRMLGNDLQFVNSIGDILLNPVNAVKLPDVTRIEFGNAGSLASTGAHLNITTNTGDINLQPGSEKVTLPINTKLDFGNGTTTMQQTVDKFDIKSVTPIAMNTSAVVLPDHTDLIFGDHTRRISSDGDTLFVYSKDLLSLESNNVRISGNLIVSKQSTFTIESETNFDSGIITLGGGSIRDIIDMYTGGVPNTTTIKTDSTHNLRIGDKVHITDTIPNIDGDYVVSTVPSSDTFTIAIPFPGVPQGADVQGNVRSLLTMNTGYDVGVQANWHTGMSDDTDGSRLAFFGFDRSTKRWTFITEATRVNNTFSGTPGDIDIHTLYADSISASHLISSLDTGNNLVSGSNFYVTGGSLNGTVIGNTVPAEGTFTYLHVKNGLIMENNSVVQNLNADLLDGLDSSAFVQRDGSTTLLQDWFAGGYRITTAGITDTTLVEDGLVFSGPNGKLITKTGITYIDGVFTVPKMGPFQLTGDIDLNGFTIKGGKFDNGQITNTVYSNGTINNTHFDTGTITNTVSSDSIFKDGSILTSSIDRTTFTNGDIQDTDITSSDIKNGTMIGTTVSQVEISSSSYVDGTLTRNAITTSSFTSGSISSSTADTVSVSNSNIETTVFSNGDINTSRIVNTTFADGNITGSSVAHGSIEDNDIVDSRIGTSSFTNGDISTTDITESKISDTDIAQSRVSQTEIKTSTVVDSTIRTSSFQDGIVTASNVSNSNVETTRITTSDFTNGTISTTDIISSNINDTDIHDSRVVDTDFKDGTISTSDIITSIFTDGEILSTDISTSTIRESSLSNNELDTNNFTNGTIHTSSIDTSEIKTSTFSQGSISNSTVTDTNITSSTYTNGDISATIISSSVYKNGSIEDSTAKRMFVTDSNLKTSLFEDGNVKNTDITTSRYVDGSIATTAISTSSFITGTVDSTAITTSSFDNGTMNDNIMLRNVFKDGNISNTDVVNSRIKDSSLENSTFTDGEISTTAIDSSTFDRGNVSNTTIKTSVYEDGRINTTLFEDGQIKTSQFTSGTVDHSSFTQGSIDTSDIRVPIGNSIDVTTGEILFRDDQISGEKIKGGTADVDISGNSETVTNGLYRRDFDRDNTIMKADVAGEPHTLVVPENTLVGRLNGQLIEALSVETVQEMLDIVRKALFLDNSILKADVAHEPEALVLPENTLLARLQGGEISAVPSREWLHTYGALLTDGHRTYPDGAAMTGNLYVSYERIAMTTGQTRDLDLNVETSYVMVNYSRVSQEAKCTLGRGLSDGHKKVIMVSKIAEKAVLEVSCDFIAPGSPNPVWLVFHLPGQSAVLQWDTVLAKWVIVGTGCQVLTRDDLLEPNWLEDLTLVAD